MLCRSRARAIPINWPQYRAFEMMRRTTVCYYAKRPEARHFRSDLYMELDRMTVAATQTLNATSSKCSTIQNEVLTLI